MMIIITLTDIIKKIVKQSLMSSLMILLRQASIIVSWFAIMYVFEANGFFMLWLIRLKTSLHPNVLSNMEFA